ncbi:hypothetical protein BHE74_00001337 [Ensete ventricosum]|nr:hypothetical protein GW17_00038343 [Ensete ventricosum]RWW89675.1 hypothetical protein BHE74_00001337 [Ensete ventricosum]
MARILPRALIRYPYCSHRLLLAAEPALLPLSARLLALRGRSDARIVAVDVAGEDDAGEVEDEDEIDVLGLRRLEDAIHAISIRRSAPDWLPFIPGSSYWVPPPRRTVGVLEVVRKLANPLTEEETMSLTNIRGWPSSAYFVEGDGFIAIFVCENKLVDIREEKKRIFLVN